MREHLCKFLFPRQSIWDREIVFTKHSPNLWPCEQVSRVADWVQYLSQGAKKCRLFFTCTPTSITKLKSMEEIVRLEVGLPILFGSLCSYAVPPKTVTSTTPALSPTSFLLLRKWCPYSKVTQNRSVRSKLIAIGEVGN